MAKGKGGNTISTVEALVSDVLNEMGFTLWDVRFEKEGPDWFLRIFIDKKDGVMDMDACEAATRAINPVIDQADPIDVSYFLEVGSPGLGRKLTKPVHYEKMLGKQVLIHLIRAENGIRDIVGTLVCKNENEIIINTNEKEQTIDMATVSYVKLNDDTDLF